MNTLTKEFLRKELLKKRDALPYKEIIFKSILIKEKLCGLPEYKTASSIMFYVSCKSEVQTHDIIKEALAEKKVIVPKVMHDEIHAALLADFNQLIPSGKFNILEPAYPVIIRQKNIPLVIVAGLGFDRNGNRIGYGLGYYDRFLKTLPHALKIGLAYDFQIVEQIPVQEYDVAVDIVVTNTEVIRLQ